MKINDNKHLSLNQRKIIQTGIENRSTKVAIAKTIGKDPTTVAKEIKKHRKLSPRNTFNYPTICIHIKDCKKCYSKCDKYEELTCNRRDKSPGACNKCPKSRSCHLDKYFYYADKANKEYLEELVDSREGVNLTIVEKNKLGNTLKPLMDQGQSIYQIKSAHPEITQCSKTLYNYIKADVFKDNGITVFSLKEQVNRKPRYSEKYKKRKDPVCYDGHTYNDYLDFKNYNPNTLTTEMDTVMNSLSGPYIQTFLFQDTGIMIGRLHQEKTSESMAKSIDYYQSILTPEEFSKFFSLLLTDRGTEFEKIDLFIADSDGIVRLNIFYCDPYKSSQKPHVENTHNYVRDIIPNEVDLTNLTQEDLDLMFSHINSTPRASLNGKTPYEMFSFLYGNPDNPNYAKNLLKKLGISEIARDEVVLKPYLLKSINKK